MQRSVAKSPIKNNGRRKPGTFFQMGKAAIPALEPLGHLAAHVYLVLASHWNADKEASWPGLELLVKEIGCSRRALEYTLKQLMAAGLIAGQRRARKSTVYRFLEVQQGAPQESDEVQPTALHGEGEVQKPTPVKCNGLHPEQDKLKNKTKATAPALVFYKVHKKPKPPQPPTEDSVFGKVERVRHAIEQQSPNLPWTAKALARLRTEVKRIPTLTAARWVACVENRYRSVGVGRDDLPENFILQLPRYISGPLDRYGKLLDDLNGMSRPINSRAERTRQSVDSVIREIDAWERRLHPEDADEDGPGSTIQ